MAVLAREKIARDAKAKFSLLASSPFYRTARVRTFNINWRSLSREVLTTRGKHWGKSAPELQQLQLHMYISIRLLGKQTIIQFEGLPYM